MPEAQKVLIMFLRYLGVVLCSAIIAVIMPLSWMDAVHQWLGLGSLPQGEIVEYLARSLSALYVLQGALMIFLSYDVIRYKPVLTFWVYLSLIFGITMILVDIAAGLPWMWTGFEGPFVVVMCLIMLGLIKKLPVSNA